MRGFVRQRSPGTWQLGWKERDAVTGIWKQKTRTFRGTKKPADAELAKIVTSLNDGSYVEPSKITVREFLERWLRDYVDLHVPKENTGRGYRTIVRSHLIPSLGAIPLAKLTPARMQQYYREQLASGRLKGAGKPGPSQATGKPLGAKTVHNHHLALHKALEFAVKWGLVARNAADPPQKPQTEMTTWTPAEAVTFLTAARESGNRYYPLFAAMLYTGARLGELLGARWADVDLDAGTFVVQQTLERSGRSPQFGTPKSKRSRRTIPLPPELVTILRAWKATQNEERLLLGPDYRDLGFVFTIAGGGPINENNLRNQSYERLVKLAGVRRVRPHDLRHCYASTLLADGVPLKTVSELLGHSSVSITADIYGHLTLETKRAAVERLGRIFAVGGGT
jgi:integrase